MHPPKKQAEGASGKGQGFCLSLAPLTLNLIKIALLSALGICAALSAQAEPNINGETGYINMPSGRIEADGTFRMGYSFARPYSSIWSSVTLLPRVELYARYVRIMGIPGFANSPGYGDYKDKVASGKVLLLEEDWNTPSLAFGINDVQGTDLFAAKYLAASKQFGALDTTIGVGTGRISGVFAGARYAPAEWNGIALAAEYDANNYKQDPFAAQTNMDQRKKGIGLALDYRWGWLGSQLAYRDGKPGINAYASIPLEAKEFISKLDEPAPDTEVVARPTPEQWDADPQYRRALIERLLKQDFKNIHLKVSGHVVEATLINTRISLASRAVGRAVRSILLRSPLGTREIRIHYTVSDMPFATYTFFDAERLQRYFNGLESRKQLAPYVAIDYAEPQKSAGNEEILDGLEQEYFQTRLDSNEGDIVSFRGKGAGLDKIRVAPGLGIYFNDPSGAFRYEVFANAAIEKQAGTGLFLKATTQLTVNQNVSGVTNPSNSLLPHVRTDVADYKKNGNVKLTQALVNQFFHPEQRVYARASAGLYEEMFGGTGGQVLYYPGRAPWAFDVSVDALKQRDARGWSGFRNYSTVTALAAMHYRLPISGVTATARAGRFLAGDLGTRLEMKRRFRSGFQVGAWYSLTNGHDITNPGTPDKPYHDKGVFMSIPLGSMLTRDTQTAPKIAISPWTRDVGQMVASPADLYDIMEPAYSNMRDRDGLQYFGDLDDSYDQPRNPTVMDRIQWANWKEDRSHVLNGLTSTDTWLQVGMGLGIAALSSGLDKPADRWAVRRTGSRFSKAIAAVGNNLPLVVGGVAGLLALDDFDQRRCATSFTALEAGVAGVLASEASKYVVGRSRPQAGMGSGDFHPLHSNGTAGFPSGHATAMWAMVTPYAKEYSAPWLYGLAAVTNLARVADRKHFVSDTVGGALLGYAIGDSFWRWHRTSQPKLTLDGTGVRLTWRTDIRDRDLLQYIGGLDDNFEQSREPSVLDRIRWPNWSENAQAQMLAVSSQGATGGLVIPSAEVLPLGALALTYGNYQEPQLGTYSTRQNLSFGVGLLSHVELFGRFTNYVNPSPEPILANGVRDISANLKLQLPTPWSRGPKVALGLNDVSGGAVNFKSDYLVASDQYGPLLASLGYAHGSSGTQSRKPTFDGAFGGLEWRLGKSGLSVLAEHDGQQKHAGLRWHSQPLASLGQSQLVGSLQQSFGAITPAGSSANATNFALSLLIPLDNNWARVGDFNLDPYEELPAMDAKPDLAAMQPTAEDRLVSLRKALLAVGLERVRVGLREGSLGSLLVVEYENHRYGQNEADALGLVLGLGAEMAPLGTQRVHAVAYKEGLRLHETSVGVDVYRAFLRNGSASSVRDSMRWERLPPDLAVQTRWIDSEPTSVSLVRIEIKPDLNYTLGTEVGAFDYSLAANVQAVAPLWAGGRLYTNYMLPVANSPNMGVGAVFESSRQRSGLKTVALQQSFWLGNQVLANVAAGRFQYDTLGAQAEAAVFVPNSDDMLRFRGAGYRQVPGGLAGQDRALAGSYRHMLTPTMWLEAGAQRYSDGSNGPSVEWTRWFGDVGVQLFYRKGGIHQFAGMQMSFPLTPRQGMKPGPMILTGASQFSQGIRTQLTTAGQPANLVLPGAVRDIRLETSLDVDQLNAGRLSQDYFAGQVPRMRDAFFRYAIKQQGNVE